LSATMFILLAVVCIRLASDASGLKQEVARLNTSLVNATEETAGLESRLALLEAGFLKLENSLALLNLTFETKLLVQEAELNRLTTEFAEMEDQLVWYFDWFGANSNLGSADAFTLSPFLRECVTGVIKLPCVAMKNEKNLGLGYLDDLSIGRADFIQNVSFTLKRGGGDCEDLAVLFMAELNYLRSAYNLPFETFVPAWDREYIIGGGYYFPDAEAHSLQGSRVYVACYSQPTQGHCINAICSEDLVAVIQRDRRADHINEFCDFVEPQEYGILKVLTAEAGRTWLYDGFNYDPFLGWRLFISSEDLCMETEAGWKCFTDYSERLAELLGS